MTDERFAMADLTAGQLNAMVKKHGGGKGVGRFLRGETIVIETKDSPVKKLLEFVGPVSFPAVTKFVVAEKLVEGKTIDGLKVTWLGDNIKTSFLKKVEQHVASRAGRQHKLIVLDSFDSAIITELGGDRKIEIAFGQYWDFLRTANRALWYVAYIRDIYGILWAVCARWHGDGLGVEAGSLGSDRGWIAGRQFVSA